MKTTLLLSFTLLLLAPAAKCDYELRLVGGQGDHEGNVHIKYEDEWGIICDDGWGMHQAQVVCRELGFGVAVGFSVSNRFEATLPKIWLDEVECTGDERELGHCDREAWGYSDCSEDEAAGVICREIPNQGRPTPPPTLPTPEEVEEYPVRIRGGRVSGEGWVEVRIGEAWGVICGQDWTLLEAAVACKQVGLKLASSALKSDYFGVGDKPRLLTRVKCTGKENALHECKHFGVLEGKCASSSDLAGVICTDKLPDLQPNATLLQTSMILQDRPMAHLSCSMEEGCLGEQAYITRRSTPHWTHITRRLFRFSSSILNVGTADFRPNIPRNAWEWHDCHQHYHSMEIFATYDIVTLEGEELLHGHKASFCLEDVECQEGVEKKYRCSDRNDQGITPGCADNYLNDIDCQWIDVTELEAGHYKFRLHANPHRLVAELDYDNNCIECPLHYTGNSVGLSTCEFSPCN